MCAALFLTETLINNYVDFGYSLLNLTLFLRMSNLIYPFASLTKHYDLYSDFYILIFYFLSMAKCKVLTLKNVQKTNEKQSFIIIH